LFYTIGFNFDIIFGGAALELNTDVTLEGLHYDEILMLTLGGLHVKHTV
jgi:hypothetical protein